MKFTTGVFGALIAASAAAAAAAAAAQDSPIIHDGEFNFLSAQFGDEWAAQDIRID
ncbi:hypothetical protein AB0T83_18360 [Fluviibacterium sp. DFM31]|uniref:Uncharacterized protein n=1 Tax=Meridianimarinicoccus marinus TaxID=3231483 RepID=A0ABV3LAZ2_9RHOB